MPSHGNQSSEFHKPSNFLPEQAQEREPRVWWDTVMFLCLLRLTPRDSLRAFYIIIKTSIKKFFELRG